MRRLILVLLGALDLGDTAELLGTVLPLLACERKGVSKRRILQHHVYCDYQSQKTKKKKHTLLAGSLLDLAGGTDTDETVVGLELLEGLGGVVDQSEAGALTTTVLCAETEDGDLVLVGLVQVGQLLTELVLGDVGAVGVEDVPRYSRKDVRSVFSGFSMLVSVCVRVASSDCIPLSLSFFCAGWLSNFNVARLRCISHTQIQNEGGNQGGSYTTICLRASRGLRMNLRVRRVTGESAILVCALDGGSVDGVSEDVELSIFVWCGLG